MSRKPTLRACVLSLLVLFAAVGAGTMRAGSSEAELGIQIGAVFPDDVLTGRSESAEPAVGFRANYNFHRHWGWFIDAWQADLRTAATPTSVRADAPTFAARTGAEVLLGPDTRQHRWFIDFGGGLVTFDPKNMPSVNRTFGSASFGMRHAVGSAAYLRWEFRGDRTIDDDGFAGEDVTLGQFLVGLTWGIGGGRTDADADTVIDRLDRCADTPPGAEVDADGCPRDGDEDGVYDGLDACPEGPVGARVDESGCPLDSDGDGVIDADDACPGTGRGLAVDGRGCPPDADGDGVGDTVDSCPGTPRGAAVDADGCAADSDGDGAPDYKDACPGTAAGENVDIRGCPVPKPVAPIPEGQRTLVLEGVNFALNSAELTQNSRRLLGVVARSLRAWPEVRVEVGGYTDSTGGAEHNLALSRRRADAVRQFLIDQGVDGQRLEARGYGSANPVADDSTEEGKRLNRRVELKRRD